jgi:hypothetical protein
MAVATSFPPHAAFPHPRRPAALLLALVGLPVSVLGSPHGSVPSSLLPLREIVTTRMPAPSRRWTAVPEIECTTPCESMQPTRPRSPSRPGEGSVGLRPLRCRGAVCSSREPDSVGADFALGRRGAAPPAPAVARSPGIPPLRAARLPTPRAAPALVLATLASDREGSTSTVRSRRRWRTGAASDRASSACTSGTLASTSMIRRADGENQAGYER